MQNLDGSCRINSRQSNIVVESRKAVQLQDIGWQSRSRKRKEGTMLMTLGSMQGIETD